MKQQLYTFGGLYDPKFEKASCGFGLMAHMDGEPSHQLVQKAVKALACMTHRGAIAADGKSGDGCGLLMKMPTSFMQQAASEIGIPLKDPFAVGMVFLSPAPRLAQAAQKAMAEALERFDFKLLGWRDVPVDSSVCGEMALSSLPQMKQCFVAVPTQLEVEEIDRKLFFARRYCEKIIADSDPDFYIASLSSRVISYKGLVMPNALPEFFQDLGNPDLQSAIVVFHQRFSTNTLPQWRLAQPFRFLSHNGEINTIQGNRHWALARTSKFLSDQMSDIESISPLVDSTGSDSMSLDNMLEVLLAGGLDLFHAMRLLIPPAWQNVEKMDPKLRAFYEYNAMRMEPWDGPAGIVMTDGRYAACILDRNGLRPARYMVTRDRIITLASETGVNPVPAEDILIKGRLKPGEMVAVDTETGELLLPGDIDKSLANKRDFGDWLKKHTKRIESEFDGEQLDPNRPINQTLLVQKKMYQLTFEEQSQVLSVLAQNGQEAVGSMGDDTPLPVLSYKVRSTYDYFRQQFAQVTNPPIDPLRESVVMSLETFFGSELNFFADTDKDLRIVVDSPVLSYAKLQKLLELKVPGLACSRIDLNYSQSESLQHAILAICDQAESAVRNGSGLLILSDRDLVAGKIPVHAALATGAVHHRLLQSGLRCDANIIVESGTVRDPHHFAVLIGYGATAVYPYLAYATIEEMHKTGQVIGDLEILLANYRKGIDKGLYKIMSKMGISTIASYRGAQLFESVGLHQEVVDLCFTGTINRLQGTRFEHLAADQITLSKKAWKLRVPIEQGGLLKYVHDAEYHAFNPDVVMLLQKAVQNSDYATYQQYAATVNNRPCVAFRDLLHLKNDQTAIAVEEVESEAEILKRFDSAGMSLGALSPEAHESLAIAMNRLGGRSNSGEGGEDPARYGTERTSKIKQVASGRFGVTPHYLVNAEVIQIKVAQGAKPGEGGQLPGHKVNDLIAELRYSRPGVSLISPPPHHDIYSIEDLAQLIFDLKQINPNCLVSVKLVAEAGVGTIAAGVAKAYADLITISGYDGGTGASPLTSIKYAGSPWELGLTEAHEALRVNNLRDKVRLQADGGLKTGLDVIKAAILGAESFGFGTAPMVALGCKYLRICHLNNCATGVATQDERLRRDHFIGLPLMVENYFRFVAQEVRELMATLGVKKLTDLIGRTDLLNLTLGDSAKQSSLDLSPILQSAKGPDDKPRFCSNPKNDPYDKGELAEEMVQQILPAIEAKQGGEFNFNIRNFNRSIGARLSGEIAKRYGNLGMQDSPITIHFKGSAGQSFGVWNAGGLYLNLIGDANDYVGKGMAGGQLIITPPPTAAYSTKSSTIIGNTCLYGATGGVLYATGLAGERFAVRNSGAHAVVEGLGDHGCEYMTGGSVVVLGATGHNFGAGMTGGYAYVLDEEGDFVDKYNHELIDIHRICSEQTEAYRSDLRLKIADYVNSTKSSWAEEILGRFEEMLPLFWLIKPKAETLEDLLINLNRAQ